ncbi:MAG: glycosyltransferase [Planctomycetota bacterium]|nr:MAG: glycosyltransferase [Planctomycetota bacterium]
MKSLLFLISSMGGGGAQRIASLLSQVLGRDYRIFWVLKSPEVVYPMAGEVVTDCCFGLPVQRHFVGSLWKLARLVERVRRLKRRLGVKATISFMEDSNLLNVLSGGKSLVNIQSSWAKSTPSCLAERWMHLSCPWFYRRADRVICISEGVAELLRRKGVPPQKIEVIYNGLDLRDIGEKMGQAIPSSHQELFKKPTILHCGRFTFAKGQWQLVRVLRIVKEKVPEVQLVFIGGKSQAKDLYDYIRRLAESSPYRRDIHFLGFQENPFKYFVRGSVFAFPSIYEGLGMALVEAMACGLPVVAADCLTGPREVLSPGSGVGGIAEGLEYGPYGVLVPAGDGVLPADIHQPLTRPERCLAEALVRFLTDEELRQDYGRRARERAREFDMEEIGRRWREVIEG